MRTSLACLAFAALLLGTGCSDRDLVRRTHPATDPDRLPSPQQVLSLNAHLLDGDMIVFQDWSYSASLREVSGTGQRLDANRFQEADGFFNVPLDSIAIFESRDLRQGAVPAGMMVVTVLSGAVTVACLANPKACFGSCPTFYVEDPPGSGEWNLVAEGFSSSIARPLEATDIDALWPAHALTSGRDFRLKVTNEAYETHVIRHADLLAVPLPDDGSRAGIDAEGRVHQLDSIFVPSKAVSSAGDESLTALREADGFEWVSLADENDLGTKETIELEFALPAAESPGELALVLHLRQSLMSTWLFYQALSYLGDTAAHWLAELERGSQESLDRTFALGRALGGIEVQLRDADSPEGWTTVQTVHETGPLARDVDLVPLGALPAGTIDVRLRLTQGLWRLDQVALATTSKTIEPVRCPPRRVTRSDSQADPLALDALLDPEQTLVTLPGDELFLHYELPEGERFEILLESRGWYLEWMREEWLEEQNPWAAARMLLDPESSLKELAPAYKEVEAEMEDLFWGSRYAQP